MDLLSKLMCLILLVNPTYSGTTTKWTFKAMQPGRILGGLEAEPGQFPWQVLLVIQYYEWGILGCGGSLISDQWVITAAHCVDGFYHQKANNIGLFFGMTNISSWQMGNNEDPQPEERVMESNVYYTHPTWHEEAKFPDGDLALIKLPIPIAFSDDVRPISLPLWNDTKHDGDQVVLSGWGKVSDGSNVSDVLMTTNSTVMSKDECMEVYGPVITDAIICSADDESHGICKGDSGNPMSYCDNEKGTWVLIGVASFLSDNGCEYGEPSGFTRIQSYLDWIYAVTGLPNPNPDHIPNHAELSCRSLSMLLVISVTWHLANHLSLLGKPLQVNRK